MKERDKYKNKLNEQRNILKEAGIEYLDELKEIVYFYKNYKDEFLDFINMKKNNININNNNIDIINSPEYIKLKQDYISLKTINDDNNSRILDLETKLGMLNSNVKDDNLFEQLKNKNNTLQNDLKKLNQEISELRNKSPEKSTFENNIDRQSIIDEITLSLKSEFLLEKEGIVKKHEKIIKDIKNEKDQIISELKSKIENKSNKNKNIKENKNTIEYLYKGFTIYDYSDIKWKQIAGKFTYNKFKMLYKFNNAIEKDEKVDQNTYNEVIEYLNEKAVYNGSGNMKKLSPYYKIKLKRISEIYDIFREDLINVNIKTSFISSLNKEQYILFINILNNEIDKRKSNLNDISSDSNESVKYFNNKNKEKQKCGNFGHDCNNYVTDRKYCQECMEDGYFTTDDESD